MLMTAGLGTRLRPFTELEPKCLVPLMGVPMAQFAVDLLVSTGVRHIVANVHHHAEQASRGLLALDRGEAELSLSDESALLLGSAGGIRKALPLLQKDGRKPFFLLNADVLCDADLQGLELRHRRLRAQYGVKLTLMVYSIAPGQGSYREIQFDSRTGLMTGLGALVSGKPFFVGAAVLEPEALDQVPAEGPAEFVPTILEPALREGKVGIFESSGEWHDVGSPALWLDAHLALLRLLETDGPRLWSRRIEAVSKRLAPGIWVGRDSSRNIQAAEWAAPLYWSASGDETARPPRQMGPRAALYGGLGAVSEPKDGIGMRGVWAPVQSR